MARSKPRGKRGRGSGGGKEVEVDEPTVEPSQDITDQPADSQKEMEEDHGSSTYIEGLKQKGCSQFAAVEVSKVIKDFIPLNDLTDDVIKAIKDLPDSKLPTALTEFSESDFENLADKLGHLISLLKSWKENPEKSNETVAVAVAEGLTVESDAVNPAAPPGPNRERLKEILDRTKYKHEVTVTQRRYGPPPEWVGDPPGHTTETFIGKLPRDVFEDELVLLIEDLVGKDSIYDLRLMLDTVTGLNRGFSFVSFQTKEQMQLAISKLNEHEIRPGKMLRVNHSTPNLRLFVGNIPKTKSKEELIEEFKKITGGLNDVIVYACADDPHKKNRGFAFLEFETHALAADARKKLARPGFRVWNHDIAVDWAEPMEEVDETVMATVKVLYVKNLTADVTEEMLQEKFAPFGNYDRVRKLKDYAFIHFTERENAIKAMEGLNNTIIGKNAVEITLAKPVSERAKQKKDQRRTRGYNMYPSNNSYGYGGPMRGRGGPPAYYGGRGGGGMGGYGGEDAWGGGGWGEDPYGYGYGYGYGYPGYGYGYGDSGYYGQPAPPPPMGGGMRPGPGMRGRGFPQMHPGGMWRGGPPRGGPRGPAPGWGGPGMPPAPRGGGMMRGGPWRGGPGGMRGGRGGPRGPRGGRGGGQPGGKRKLPGEEDSDAKKAKVNNGENGGDAGAAGAGGATDSSWSEQQPAEGAAAGAGGTAAGDQWYQDSFGGEAESWQ